MVKNAALGLNLVDWARQDCGKDTGAQDSWTYRLIESILQATDLFPWVSYPCILGSDVAGEVAEVGSDVKNLNAGDRVLGMARHRARSSSRCSLPGVHRASIAYGLQDARLGPLRERERSPTPAAYRCVRPLSATLPGSAVSDITATPVQWRDHSDCESEACTTLD